MADTIMTCWRLDKAQRRRAKKQARLKKMTESDYFREALEEKLQRDERATESEAVHG